MAAKSCSVSSGRGRTAGATKLIRELVAQAQTSPKSSASPQAGQRDNQDLLFEDEVDGVRCTLIRVGRAEKPLVSLSPREQEIVRMIAKGYPNKAIADVLEISAWTVGTHLRRIFAKLHVNSRAAMVARVAVEGFLPGNGDIRSG